MQKKNRFFIIAFILILLIPMLDCIFNFSPVKDLFEKRLPNPKPPLPRTLLEVMDYTRNFEKFFNDHYGFRKSFIVLNSNIMDKVFNESPDARAVMGQEDWLYFDNYDSLLDVEGRAMIDDDLIERGVEAFYRNWQLMRSKNIRYLLVIAADKSTVYPEFLPSYIKPHKTHRIDKFLTALKEKYPDFPVVDLRPVMFEAKKKDEIYQRTDTHWNRRGAHYAYLAIAPKLGLKPRPRSDYENISDEMLMGDISHIMGLEMENPNLSLKPKFKLSARMIEELPAKLKHFHRPSYYLNENRNLPVFFSYNDSFFGELEIFVAEHFSESIFVNEFPCELNYETIKNFHPDTVVQEFWEGRLGALLAKCK